MAHSGMDYPKDLPATWPFRAAGTVFIAAMVWFCMGFAIKDTGEELSNHMPVFWILILIRRSSRGRRGGLQHLPGAPPQAHG